MPRGTKKNAHQHNNRHENGIVAPGKRIVKQKSNGHLNGSPDDRSRANTPPLPTSLPVQVTSSENHAEGASTSLVESRRGGAAVIDRAKVAEESIVGQYETTENSRLFSGKMAVDQNHRKIDVSTVRSRPAYGNGGMQFALTVLKACPLRDTLAILTFLLSLSPTFITLTNTVFTILTFVPPTGSFSGFPSLSDIFQGYSSPVSFSTMCIIDIIGIAIWLPLFRPLQLLVLDWAQAMIATTLGGGYTNRPGGSDSTLLCISIVSATHLSRYKRLILRILHRTWLGRWAPLVDVLNRTPPAISDPGPTSRPLVRNMKMLIALHIVMQGLGRLARKWLLQYRDKTLSESSNNLQDPEAIAGAHINHDLVSSAELSQNPPISPNELRSKVSLQNLKDVRDKHVLQKRKRKLGNYVRSQQPLWAAFAATKATIMREYEQSQATTVAKDSEATDVQNLGSAPFVQNPGRIWVTMVRPSSFFFDTSVFPSNVQILEEHDSNNAALVDGEGIDRSKPFYVRINGAAWALTKIIRIANNELQDGPGQSWTGEVYGLSPAYSYRCCFVRCEDEVVIHYETVVTPSSPVSEQGSFGVVHATQHQHLRPSSPASPITTLKSSIAASEISLDSTASQQRRIRKDGKAAIVALKRDLDVLQEKLNRVGLNEKGLQNRKLQQSQHMRQADDAITSITNELDSYANLSEDEPPEWQKQKSKWEHERTSQFKIRQELQRYRESSHRDTTMLQNEALTATQKRDRLLHRTAKLSDQHLRLQPSTSTDITIKDRQVATHNAKVIQRQHLEAHYQEQISNLIRRYQDLQFRGRQFWEQAQVLETAHSQQMLMASQSSMSDSRPMTPESELPGTTLNSGALTGPRFLFFGATEGLSGQANGVNSNASHRGEGTRGRSISMLSGNSIYTDFDEDPEPPPMPVLNRNAFGGITNDRKDCGSGSSGSGGQSPRLRKSGFGHSSGGSPLAE